MSTQQELARLIELAITEVMKETYDQNIIRKPMRRATMGRMWSNIQRRKKLPVYDLAYPGGK